MFHEYVSILRVKRYSQNFIVFLGVLVAILAVGVPVTPILVANTLVLFIIYCFISSANYIVNDIVDREYDKKHPEKKSRLITHGVIPIGNAAFLLLLLWGAGVYLGYLFFDFTIVGMLILFILSAFLYNLKPIRSKDIVFLDVFSESLNNPLRFVAGWYVATLSIPSLPVILFLWFYASIPMAAKRLAEIRYLGKQKAGQYRAVFRKYTEKKLRKSMVLYTLLSFLMLLWVAVRVNLLLGIPALLMLAQMAWYYRIALKQNSIAQKPFKIYQEPAFTLFSLLIVALALAIIAA